MISLKTKFKNFKKAKAFKIIQFSSLSFLILIVTTNQTIGQDTVGVYYHIDKTKYGPSFATKLIFMSDSTFHYTLKGDLFNDFAEGSFSQFDDLIILKYITADFYKLKMSNTNITNTQLPGTIPDNLESRIPNPVAHLWPIEIIKKKNKLIVIKTKENSDRKIRIKFKKMSYIQ